VESPYTHDGDKQARLDFLTPAAIMGLTAEYYSAVPGHSLQRTLAFAVLTIAFAAMGRSIRGVTTGGAIAGAVVCFALLWAAGLGGFAGLLTVFVLTWISTRIGYARKQRLGTAEPRAGRNALQVLANLGAALVCAILSAAIAPNSRILVAMGAALAEAAADTVSSEIGQASGATPRLLTTWLRAEPGTDGAISWPGTLAGAVAAIAVACVFAGTGIFSWQEATMCAGAGFAGMVFDSMLGATLERRQIVRNNTVNFASTIFAAALAFLIS
jgi:uncharacterized protein (TIGR00297 family)